jgi:dihydropteroate synthase
VAAALLAVERGASVVRVHDVKETAQALRVYEAMRAQSLV